MNMKGSLPLLILNELSVKPGHGYYIAKQIRQKSKGVLDFAEGTLYPTLHNMEQQGLIEAFEQEEKGRMRRYYRLTAKGQSTLAKERTAWEQFSTSVNAILGGLS
ncbi:MAG: PadR family transcriptional regulator [Anaerolineae bacterium]|nr:PadR family transcriptional regulator [Anaerolineae bacterium]